MISIDTSYQHIPSTLLHNPPSYPTLSPLTPSTHPSTHPLTLPFLQHPYLHSPYPPILFPSPSSHTPYPPISLLPGVSFFPESSITTTAHPTNAILPVVHEDQGYAQGPGLGLGLAQGPGLAPGLGQGLGLTRGSQEGESKDDFYT